MKIIKTQKRQKKLCHKKFFFVFFLVEHRQPPHQYIYKYKSYDDNKDRTDDDDLPGKGDIYPLEWIHTFFSGCCTTNTHTHQIHIHNGNCNIAINPIQYTCNLYTIQSSSSMNE